MAQRIGFIGLGIMGRPMAGHLLAAGLPLVVHTRTRTKAEELLAAGTAWAASPAEVANQSDVVFICVNDTPDVQAVVLGNQGIADAARTGLIVVDHSTISPSATRDMAGQLAARGTHFLDAPISGGDIGARNATLSIMVGGDAGAFQKIHPILAHMGKTITHCGAVGNGQLTKLVNQILVTITNLAVCEALTFAKANSLDLEKTLSAISAGAAGSWQLTNLGPKMIAGDFRPGFMIDLQTKDLRLVNEAVEQAHLKLQAQPLVQALFAEAQRQGRGQEGTQALYAIVQQRAMTHSR